MFGTEGVAVPIRIYLEQPHKFDDESLRLMGIAFECARSVLNISTSEDPLSETVATKIIELARTGERDPERLCDAAIEGLRPQSKR